MIDLNDDELMEVFRAESTAILEDLEESLLALEREGPGSEAREEAYRLFHTLKGMANMAGIPAVGALCHEAEEDLAPGRSPDVEFLLARRDHVERLLAGDEAGATQAREAEEDHEGAPRPEARSVPVDVRRLDNLLNLVGELVVAHTRLEYEWRTREGRPGEDTLSGLSHLVRSLRDEVLRARLIPARTLFAHLPRLARDAAHNHAKEARVVVEDADVELDRAIVDRLTGALAHLVQNAVVHGIEPPDDRARRGKPREGVIRLSAHRENEMVIVEVEDDGRGVDVDAIRTHARESHLVPREAAAALTPEQAIELLLLPGFTTEAAAGKHAGRGVGLTAAREVARALGGELSVTAREGRGMRVAFRLPPTVAVLDTLIAEAEGTQVALPLRNVRRILPASVARRIGGAPGLLHEGEPIPVLAVDGSARAPPEGGYVVVAEAANGTFALGVDRVQGTHSSVLKPLDAGAGAQRTYLGATVLGNGKLALVLDLDAYPGEWTT